MSAITQTAKRVSIEGHYISKWGCTVIAAMACDDGRMLFALIGQPDHDLGRVADLVRGWATSAGCAIAHDALATVSPAKAARKRSAFWRFLKGLARGEA